MSDFYDPLSGASPSQLVRGGQKLEPLLQTWPAQLISSTLAPGRAYSGYYSPPSTVPGSVSEEDIYRRQLGQQQMYGDVSNLASLMTGAPRSGGAGSGVSYGPGGRPLITYTHLPKIKELYQQGKTYKEIGEELGIPRNSVAGIISRARIKRDLPTRKPGYTEAMPRILEQKKQGFSHAEIAKNLQLSVDQVDRAVKAARTSGTIQERQQPSLPRLKFMEKPFSEDDEGGTTLGSGVTHPLLQEFWGMLSPP